jgi:cytochrome c-type biogenesis protein CcmF
MVLGEVLLWSAMVCLLLQVMAAFFKKEIFRGLYRLSALLATSVVALLTYYFVAPDFNYYYVYTHIGTGTPLVYKLSSVWAGQEGTFLLWAWVAIITGWRISERWDVHDPYSRDALVLTSLFGAFFLYLAFTMHPFATTYSAMEGYASDKGIPMENILSYSRSTGEYSQKEGFVEGMGTNPFLASPWMALHPPVVFIAYGTITAVAACLLAYLIRGSGDWKGVSLFWNRVSWLFLTFGILVGGIWAYEELTYGGYWVWDPVETSSLIPWLTLTAFLHTARRPGFNLLSPFLGVFTFVFVVYCTYITRSGILKSVHGYSETTVGQVLIYSILGLAALTLLLSARRFSLPGMERDIRHPKNTTYLLVGVLLALSGVLLFGLSKPVYIVLSGGEEVQVPKAFFNQNSFPFVVGIFFLLGFCLLSYVKGSYLSGSIGTAALLSGLFYWKGGPFDHRVVDTLFPILALAALAVLKRFRDRPSVYPAHLIHLGAILLIFGVVASSGLEETREGLYYLYPKEVGVEKDIGKGYTLTLEGIDMEKDRDGNWVQYVILSVHKGGEEVFRGRPEMTMTERFGPIAHVAIYRGISDIYLILPPPGGMQYPSGEVVVPIVVKFLPYIASLWTGSFLMVLGVSLGLLRGRI